MMDWLEGLKKGVGVGISAEGNGRSWSRSSRRPEMETCKFVIGSVSMVLGFSAGESPNTDREPSENKITTKEGLRT